MAEYVQLRLEESIEELQQLEKAGIFSVKEVKAIMRNRKEHEYRIQKRTKSKEDFLKFILYEISLLDLYVKRQKACADAKKRSEIFHSLASRINRLFKFVENRHKNDVTVWLSHIDFCKKINYRNLISPLFMQMLQVHSCSPDAWITAAKWEMKENKSSQTARDLILRGLRFIPDSKLLYQEGFRLELKYTEIIRKRGEILGVAKDEDDNKIPDKVLEGALAYAYFKNAKNAINDTEFHLTFISICDEFEFASDLQERITADLKVTHSKDECLWTFIANRHFQSIKPRRETIRSFFDTFDSAVEELPTTTMYKKCIDSCLSKYKDVEFANYRIALLNYSLKKIKNCVKKGLATEDIYTQWASHCDDEDKEMVLKNGLKSFPDSVSMWKLCILYKIKKNSPEKDVKHLFNEAMDNIPAGKTLPIWQVAIEWLLMSAPTKVLSLLKKPIDACTPEVVKEMKTTYLELTALITGVAAAREVYKKHCTTPPIMKEFFWKMYAIEESQTKATIRDLRGVLEDLIKHFGETDVDVWLKRIQLEKQHKDGKPQTTALIHWRAIKTLKPELESKFLAAETLINTGRTFD